MRRCTTLIAATLFLCGSAAYADDPQAQQPYDPNAQQQGQLGSETAGAVNAQPLDNTKENYPGEFVARPLILPIWMAQPTLLFGINNVSIGGASGTGESVAAAFDIGLMDKLQAGAVVSFPVNNPDPTFGYFMANVQYNVIDFLNLRLDAGAIKVGPAVYGGPALSAGTTNASTGFAFGVGAAFKWKLNDMFAITSGRPYAYAVTDDIFAMQIISANGTTLKLGYVTIPIGVLAQLHPMIAVGVRVAGRFAVADAKTTGNEVFIPVGVDLLVNALKPLDLGFSFDLVGNKDAYGDIRLFTIFASYRI